MERGFTRDLRDLAMIASKKQKLPTALLECTLETSFNAQLTGKNTGVRF
jgi:hypothetical protein